jgi:peptide/nickel transport system ATP-binding protein/oligopeptide transport system ATP-binding protein
MSIIEIKNLKTYFESAKGIVKAVDGVSLSINQGDTLGIVGESGCGKSMLALSVMRLAPKPGGKTVGGSILFKGTDLLKLSEKEMREIRGRDISMIFQEPMTALNPVIRIGDQITEAIRLHLGLNPKDALSHAIDMLRKTGMPSPESRITHYPHQMSGGMRQRVMIAMALACNPQLILADEPTTALDVTIQAQILELLNDLKKQLSASVVIITHDLGVIAESAQFVGVMYAGKLVEYCRTADLFSTPAHPYTIGLMDSIPGFEKHQLEMKRLRVIPGSVPNLYELPVGCSFQNRCSHVMEICRKAEPETRKVGQDHLVRCWKE